MPERIPEPERSLNEKAFLQPGTQQVAAGYAIYGPQTMLILTLGDGVKGFTLDREMGSFVLTHEDIKIPKSTQEFAINIVQPASLGSSGTTLRQRIAGR